MSDSTGEVRISLLNLLGLVRALAFGSVAVLVVGVGGCDSLDDRGWAAKVDDWELSESRLAEVVVAGQPFPLDSLAVLELARHWTALAALAVRSAAGDSLASGEALEASLWLDRREALLAADREERLGETVNVDEATVEASYLEGSLRLVAHTLRRVGPETSSAERLLQQRTAERLLNSLLEGGSWSQVVDESEDLTTQNVGGLLGLFASGELPPTLDRAAFNLEPGQISGVVQSQDGFHIIYRPIYEEVSSIFAARLRERRLADAEVQVNEELWAASPLTVVPGAAERLARMLASPASWMDSSQPLASWEEGALSAAVVAHYLVAMPERALSELDEADEVARTDLLRNLATRERRYQEAHERGVRLEADFEESLALAHAEEIEFWTNALNLTTSGDPNRAALARYIDELVARRIDPRSLSPHLEVWLLGRVNSEVRVRGVLAAIVGATRMLEGAGNGEVPRS